MATHSHESGIEIPVAGDEKALHSFLKREGLIKRNVAELKSAQKTNEGKRELLDKWKKNNPNATNADVDRLLTQVSKNQKEVAKKEGFLKRTILWGPRKAGRLVKSHPFAASALAVLAGPSVLARILKMEELDSAKLTTGTMKTFFKKAGGISGPTMSPAPGPGPYAPPPEIIG